MVVEAVVLHLSSKAQLALGSVFEVEENNERDGQLRRHLTERGDMVFIPNLPAMPHRPRGAWIGLPHRLNMAMMRIRSCCRGNEEAKRRGRKSMSA